MIVGITMLSCLAVLSVLTFVESWTIPLEFDQNGTTEYFAAGDVEAVTGDTNADSSEDSVISLLRRKEEFLTGAGPPVWIAYYANPKDTSKLTYRKLERGIVKEAINYFKSDKFEGITRGKRSVDENMNLQLKGVTEYTNTHSSSSHLAKRLKREDSTKVFYPSVLAVMEYGETWPSAEEDEHKLVMKRILYALAFWNSIDLQLIEVDPVVRIRLSGIIIAKDRDATNNLYEVCDYWTLLHYEGTFRRLEKYWGSTMRQKIDFRRGTYNIVALMTDEGESPKRSTAGSFSDGPLCNHDNLEATGVLIMSDNLEFSGLQEGVRVTARLLGHGSGNNTECKYKTQWKSRTWNKCDLDSIRESLLSNGWCMEKPMEYHDPDKPVEIILPGMLTPLEQQCKADGWRAGHACKKSTCEALRCQEDYLSLCVRRHPPLDGSECGVGMVGSNYAGNCYTYRICQNTKCVNDTTLTRL